MYLMHHSIIFWKQKIGIILTGCRSRSYNAAISYCTFWHNFAKLSLSLDCHSIALNLRFSSSALLLWQWRISLIQSSTYAYFVHSIRLFALWQQTNCFLPSTPTHLPKAVAPAFHKGRLSVVDLRIGMVALREHTVPEASPPHGRFTLSIVRVCSGNFLPEDQRCRTYYLLSDWGLIHGNWGISAHLLDS